MDRADGSLTRRYILYGRIKIRPYNICRAKGSFFNVLKLLRRSKIFIENYISDYQKAPAERHIDYISLRWSFTSLCIPFSINISSLRDF